MSWYRDRNKPPTQLPKEARVPRPDDQNQPTDIPGEYAPLSRRLAAVAEADVEHNLSARGDDRDIVARGMAAYDTARNEIAVLRQQLTIAIDEIKTRTAAHELEMKSKNAEIERLHFAVEEARNNAASDRAVRDEAMKECAAWRQFYKDLRCMFDNFEDGDPPPLPKKRGKRGATNEIATTTSATGSGGGAAGSSSELPPVTPSEPPTSNDGA